MAAQAPKFEKKSRRPVWIIVLIASLVLIAGAAFVLVKLLVGTPVNDKGGIATDTTLPTVTESQPVTESTEPPTESTEPTEESTEETTEETTEPLPDNPVDWAYYHDINPDIYAWIYIPGVDVDLPMLQSQGADDDNFYLKHNIYRNYDSNGAIYTQKANAKDFSDPVTLIYGHNMLRTGVMFSNLLYFQDKDFFNENEFLYIYIEGHILTYQIFSAHVYDTRHILNSFDFSNEEEFLDYIDQIVSPRTMIANVREGVTITTEDHIVTLSTCTRVNGVKVRYLVQGVLVDDQPTN